MRTQRRVSPTATCSLRNALLDASGALALVDWECAGEHAEAWDAALLWVFAPDWVRERLAAGYGSEGASRAAFLACVAFALTLARCSTTVKEGHPRRR